MWAASSAAARTKYRPKLHRQSSTILGDFQMIAQHFRGFYVWCLIARFRPPNEYFIATWKFFLWLWLGISDWSTMMYSQKNIIFPTFIVFNNRVWQDTFYGWKVKFLLWFHFPFICIKKGKCIVESGIFENLEKIYLIYIISHRRKTKVEVSIREFPSWYICN